MSTALLLVLCGSMMGNAMAITVSVDRHSVIPAPLRVVGIVGGICGAVVTAALANIGLAP